MFVRTIITLGLAATLAACGGEEQTADESQTEDKVTITGVSIGSTTESGHQNYVVAVSYELQSQPQGEILIGFGQGNEDYQINLTQTIPQGAGELSFNVIGPLMKNANGTPVPAYANLSPYPHEETWKALASHKLEVSPDGTIKEMPDSEEESSRS